MNEQFEAVKDNEHTDHGEYDAPRKIHEPVFEIRFTISCEEYLEEEKDRIGKDEAHHMTDIFVEDKGYHHEEHEEKDRQEF
jgi:hypothetical protein